jgi:hypothetical protein
MMGYEKKMDEIRQKNEDKLKKEQMREDQR